MLQRQSKRTHLLFAPADPLSCSSAMPSVLSKLTCVGSLSSSQFWQTGGSAEVWGRKESEDRVLITRLPPHGEVLPDFILTRGLGLSSPHSSRSKIGSSALPLMLELGEVFLQQLAFGCCTVPDPPSESHYQTLLKLPNLTMSPASWWDRDWFISHLKQQQQKLLLF